MPSISLDLHYNWANINSIIEVLHFHIIWSLFLFSNLHVNSDYTAPQTSICGREISLMDINFHEYLHISNFGICAHSISLDLHYSWVTINFVIRSTPLSYHEPLMNDLVHNVCVIQYVLRHDIISKAGDRVNITLFLSTVTYFIITNTTFNVSNLHI